MGLFKNFNGCLEWNIDWIKLTNNYRDVEEPDEHRKVFEVSQKNSSKKDKGKSHNYPKYERKCSQKFRRWGRREDKDVFNKLWDRLDEINKSAEEFFNFDSSAIFDNANLKIKGRLQNEVASRLWKDPYFLLKRLFKLYSNQSFSVREVRTLKRTIRNLKQKSTLNEKSILYNYPGKTLKTLKETIQNILTRKYNEDLNFF